MLNDIGVTVYFVISRYKREKVDINSSVRCEVPVSPHCLTVPAPLLLPAPRPLLAAVVDGSIIITNSSKSDQVNHGLVWIFGECLRISSQQWTSPDHTFSNPSPNTLNLNEIFKVPHKMVIFLNASWAKMTIKWTVFWPQCIWTSRFAEEMFVLKPPSKSEVQTIDIDFIQSRLWLSYQPVIISVCFRKHCLELAETVKNQHETRDKRQVSRWLTLL